MRSLLSYLGGKHLLAGKIIQRIPKHNCYCEVFAGAAWVLFTKEESKVEIINDINVDLVTLYRVVKHHLEEFIRYLKWILVARDEFERFKNENPQTLTDIQRSVRFYYLLKAGYSSRVVRPTFSIKTARPPSFNLLRIEEELSTIHLRLARVYIENRPYSDVINRFDDPPYYGHENEYGVGIFSRDDFEKLRNILSKIRGKFLLSINDHPKMREMFKEFRISKERTVYTAGHTHSPHKSVTELLISNY